jgi:FADH2 O2-dependent halogenase
MADFGLWTASTMLYFAAATSYERVRTARGDAARDRLFMLADEARLFEATLEASRYLDGCPDVVSYERLVEVAVRPFNRVGLFHPEVPNMYAHTAAHK